MALNVSTVQSQPSTGNWHLLCAAIITSLLTQRRGSQWVEKKLPGRRWGGLIIFIIKAGLAVAAAAASPPRAPKTKDVRH